MDNTPNKPSQLGVLFVCWGNICRSPAAEAIFQAQVEAAGLSGRIRCDSAGTIGFHSAQSPDHRMRASGAQRGYHLQGRSRKIRSADFHEFDHIIAMDRDNYSSIKHLHPGGDCARVSMMCEFATGHSDQEVPDPYYGDQSGFEHVFDLLEDACSGLLEKIKAELS